MNMDTRFFFHLSTLVQRKIVYFYNYYDVYIYSHDINNSNNNNDDFLEQFFVLVF